MSDKQRLDILLYQSGLAASRQKAKELIIEGHCQVNGQILRKPGAMLDPAETSLQLVGEVLPYVSRGGWKLEKALREFQISLTNRVCMDIGASTGGFTDCMLQNGAKFVYAIDSGKEQLAAVLRQDVRVHSMEGCNVRYISKEILLPNMPLPDFAGIDVSFISLTKILQPVCEVMDTSGELVCLIKPQFEAGPALIGKNGVVRDSKTHKKVLEDMLCFVYSIGLNILNLTWSPICGPEGNIEFLMHLSKGTEDTDRAALWTAAMNRVDSMVKQAHISLKAKENEFEENRVDC